MRHLRLHKQYKQIAVSHKDEATGDYPIYLFGEGTMLLNFDGQGGGSVILDRD